MKRTILAVSVLLASMNTGCGIDVPVDPASFFAFVNNATGRLDNVFQDAVADPFGVDPYPVLIGGDSARTFYATNLTDTSINFSGRSNDIVIPGFTGPSNVYRFTQNPRNRELLRPLVGGGSFFGQATDGRYIGFIAFEDLQAFDLTIRVTDLFGGEDRVIFEDGASRSLIPAKLFISNGRIAYQLVETVSDRHVLRVDDLSGVEPSVEISAERIGAFALSSDLLAYIADTSSEVVSLELRDLGTGITTTLDPALRSNSIFNAELFIANNRIVWSEQDGPGVSRVTAYDLVNDSTTVLADGVIGHLVGATDTHFVTEEQYTRDNGVNRIRIRRYDEDARMRVLADFRADGLAGQTRVLGDRAAWVNPDRKVVLAPLDGRDRAIFRPF